MTGAAGVNGHPAVHEMMNSLTSISSLAQTLLERDLDVTDSLRSNLREVLTRQSARLEWLIGAVLEKPPASVVAPVDVRSLVAQAARATRVEVRRVIEDADASDVVVAVDEARTRTGLEALFYALATDRATVEVLDDASIVLRRGVRDLDSPAVAWKVDFARTLLEGDGHRLEVRSTASGSVAIVELGRS